MGLEKDPPDRSSVNDFAAVDDGNDKENGGSSSQTDSPDETVEKREIDNTTLQRPSLKARLSSVSERGRSAAAERWKRSRLGDHTLLPQTQEEAGIDEPPEDDRDHDLEGDSLHRVPNFHLRGEDDDLPQ